MNRYVDLEVADDKSIFISNCAYVHLQDHGGRSHTTAFCQTKACQARALGNIRTEAVAPD